MAEETTTTAAAETTAATETSQTETKQQTEQTENKGLSAEEIKKLIQSSTDRATADLGKQIAALKKENETLKKKNMTAEEVKQLEIKEREETIAAKEAELKDKENRMFAAKAIREIGLDDGSERAVALVDFVMADEQDKITERVKAFHALVQGFVNAQVDAKFKAIGRTPSGATQTETKKEDSIAVKLGKDRAARNKQSNDVLKHYLGGK